MTDRVARYSVTEAKRNFRELVARVGAGERIVVTRRGTPVMALVPPGEVNPMRPSRPVGLAAVAGALADWQDLDDRMGEVHATRDQATDRSPPRFTSGTNDTVDLALQGVTRAALRRRLAARIRSGAGIDRGEQVFAASRSWHR